MPDTCATRRRSLTVVTATLLLLIVGPLVWWYWPLSPTARSLLGTWRVLNSPSAQYDEFTFTSDGRFSFRSIGSRPDALGTWDAADGQLSLFTPSTNVPLTWNSLEYHLWRYFSGNIHDDAGAYVVEFETPDRMHWKDYGIPTTFKTTFERVSPTPSSSRTRASSPP